MLTHVAVNHRNRDHLFQALKAAKDQGTVGPGAGERYVKVITTGFRLEAAFPAGSGTSVSSNPVAVLGFTAYKTPLGGFGVIPLVFPVAINQQAHWRSPSSSVVMNSL